MPRQPHRGDKSPRRDRFPHPLCYGLVTIGDTLLHLATLSVPPCYGNDPIPRSFLHLVPPLVCVSFPAPQVQREGEREETEREGEREGREAEVERGEGKER